MPIIDGNVSTKISNQDYLEFTLYQEDGVTPIDISAATSAIFKLRNLETGVFTEFKTDDAVQKFFITDAINGVCQLRPTASDFTTVATYSYEIIYIDSVGNHNVPNNKSYTFSVIGL